MVDYSVDSTFDLHFTKHNDFEVVEGLQEFEENLVIELWDRFEEATGLAQNLDSTKEKIRLLINRVAAEFEVIDRIQDIRITEPLDKPETLSVEVIYMTGTRFEEIL